MEFIGEIHLCVLSWMSFNFQKLWNATVMGWELQQGLVGYWMSFKNKTVQWVPWKSKKMKYKFEWHGLVSNNHWGGLVRPGSLTLLGEIHASPSVPSDFALGDMV